MLLLFLSLAATSFSAQAGLLPRKRDSLPLTDVTNGQHEDIKYLVEIDIGTPPQKVQCHLDTGSHPLYISVGTPELFDHAKSTTYVGTKTVAHIKYGIGEASGTVAYDVVAIGDHKVERQIFLAAEKHGNSPCTIGMGYAGSGSLQKTPLNANNFMQNLIAQSSLTYNVISLSLGTALDSAHHDTGSSLVNSRLTIGDIDKSLYTGKFDRIPRSTYDVGQWYGDIRGLSIGGKLIKNTALTAVFDSGATNGHLPENVAKVIVKTLKGQLHDDGRSSVPCSSLDDSSIPPIGFRINRETFVIAKGDLIYRDGDACSLAYPVKGTAPVANLGDVFLKNVYSVFDWSNGGRMSFAQRSAPTKALLPGLPAWPSAPSAR